MQPFAMIVKVRFCNSRMKKDLSPPQVSYTTSPQPLWKEITFIDFMVHDQQVYFLVHLLKNSLAMVRWFFTTHFCSKCYGSSFLRCRLSLRKNKPLHVYHSKKNCWLNLIFYLIGNFVKAGFDMGFVDPYLAKIWTRW